VMLANDLESLVSSRPEASLRSAKERAV
jgi:hypothetical protein